ncbi:MAG: Gfo/Idh/MocA family protein, partial [Planctomycetota bacterium]
RRDARIAGGGALMDPGVALIDLVQYLTGQRIRAAQAVLDAPRDPAAGRVENRADALLELDGGAAASLHVAFGTAAAAVQDGSLTVIGSRGRAVLEGVCAARDGIGARLTVVDAEGRRELPLEMVDLAAAALREFTFHLRGNGPCRLPNGAAALHTQAVVDATYAAAAGGRRITVE